MVEIVHWPASVLTPQASPFNPRPFTRSGGRSLGGIDRATRTDLGYWVGTYAGIVFRRGTLSQRRVWNALRTMIGGASGLVAVPVCSTHLLVDTGFSHFAPVLTEHSDDSPFDDDSEYSQGSVTVEMAAAAAIGATSVTLRLVHAPTASGIRFSYQHALYETGPITEEVSDTEFTVSIFPAIRAPIPADATLEVERPTCLCRLASDSEMDVEFAPGGGARPTVQFVEAVDYWGDLAAGLIE